MDFKYFDIAFEEANKAYQLDEVPIGAVIVKNGEVIAKSFNQKEKDMCCTSHAEILAIQEASKKLDNWRLEDCDIYVTLDPCPMCASAIKQSRIKNVYSALNNKDIHNLDIIREIFETDTMNAGVCFESNLDSERSKHILNTFFEKQRNN